MNLHFSHVGESAAVEPRYTEGLDVGFQKVLGCIFGDSTRRSWDLGIFFVMI